MNKKTFQYKGKEFLFMGILKCAITGRLVTSDTKTKKYANGKVTEWTYLRTSDPDNPEKKLWVREDEITKQLEDILQNLRIKNPDILKQVIEYLMNVNEGKKHNFNREISALKQEHTSIQNKLDNLIDLVADGILTREEFLHKKNKLKER